MSRWGEAWKSEELTRTFLEGIRGGIPLADEQIDVMLRLVEGRGKPVESFADLGCGDGVLSMALLQRHPRAIATLVDFSQPMIDAATCRLAAHGSNCEFVVADLGGEGWASSVAGRAPFELVVSGYAIHHLADQRKRELYAEIFSLLKPGGLFVNVDHVKSATPWIKGIFDDYLIDSLHSHHSREGSGRTREQVAEEFVHRPDRAADLLAPIEDQCEWLRHCGFADVDCYFRAFELAIFGGRHPR